MRLFRVPQGTPVKVHNNAARDWPHYSTEDKTLTRELLFGLEDLRIDPVGKVGSGPSNVTIGGWWAQQGWYGFGFCDDRFGRTGYTILVPGNLVEVL